LSLSEDRYPRLIRLIVLGTIPAIVAGLLFKDVIEARLRTPLVAAVALAAGAVLMLVAERLGTRHRDEGSLTMIDAGLIGLAQACALVPGVSRSGSTIAIAMLLGLRRESAARFTFLLAIPAILGAGGKEAIELRHLQPDAALLTLFAIGAVVSAVVGYVTIKYFLRFLAGHRLDVFSYYRLALAAVTFTWLAT
jgi:undecaprenyl-diphosphatase